MCWLILSKIVWNSFFFHFSEELKDNLLKLIRTVNSKSLMPR